MELLVSDLVAIAEPSISPALCSEISDLVAIAEPGIGPALCSELPQGSVGGGGGDGEVEGGGAGGVEATHLSLEVPRITGLVKQAVFLEGRGEKVVREMEVIVHVHFTLKCNYSSTTGYIGDYVHLLVASIMIFYKSI